MAGKPERPGREEEDQISFHDLRLGETLRFSGHGPVLVTLLEKSGRRARLAIAAPANVRIASADGEWGQGTGGGAAR